jgi:hypothetical protein
MKRTRDQQGQTIVLTTIILSLFLVAVPAVVIDVGSWFREQRDTQRVADAAALAGAQALPHDVSEARELATHYALENGGANPAISFKSTGFGGETDTIQVEIRRDAPGFFAKVFGIDSANVGAKATARASHPGAARWVAPIVVNEKHPMLNCNPQPCFGDSYVTQIQLDHLHNPGGGTAAGSFALISLNDDDVDANTLSEWLLKGYDGFMEKDKEYRSAPSANFNNGQFQSALEQRKGTEMLFPIYRRIFGSGSTAQYEVIGWVGFVVLKVIGGGSNQKLEGYFTKVVWESIPASSPPSGADFGVRTIELIE